jgi:hypothetical protein
MYGLPPDFDGSFFVGRKLEMICVNANQIYLHFNQQLTVTIESSLTYQRGDTATIINVPLSKCDLVALLEHSVTQASAGKEGKLTLKFDNGDTVQCLDDRPNYESYRIRNGDREIIV